MAEGRFREDLYYRLNLVELRMPPLRERTTDIPRFVEYFSRKYAARYGQPVWQPSPDAMRAFCEYRWPGNIRQLSYVIEQSYVLECEPSLPGHARGRTWARSICPSPTCASSAGRPSSRPCGPPRATRAVRRELLGVHPNTMTRLIGQLRTTAATLD